MKLAFILLEFFLAIAFGILTFTKHKNIAAYLEWVIAFIFTFYILSFIIDLWPARSTKHHSMRFSKPEEALGGGHSSSDNSLTADHHHQHPGRMNGQGAYF